MNTVDTITGRSPDSTAELVTELFDVTRHMEHSELLPLTSDVMYALVALTGTVGNAAVIYIILKDAQLRKWANSLPLLLAASELLMSVMICSVKAVIMCLPSDTPHQVKKSLCQVIELEYIFTLSTQLSLSVIVHVRRKKFCNPTVHLTSVYYWRSLLVVGLLTASFGIPSVVERMKYLDQKSCRLPGKGATPRVQLEYTAIFVLNVALCLSSFALILANCFKILKKKKQQKRITAEFNIHPMVQMGGQQHRVPTTAVHPPRSSLQSGHTQLEFSNICMTTEGMSSGTAESQDPQVNIWTASSYIPASQNTLTSSEPTGQQDVGFVSWIRLGEGNNLGPGSGSVYDLNNCSEYRTPAHAQDDVEKSRRVHNSQALKRDNQIMMTTVLMAGVFLLGKVVASLDSLMSLGSAIYFVKPLSLSGFAAHPTSVCSDPPT